MSYFRLPWNFKYVLDCSNADSSVASNAISESNPLPVQIVLCYELLLGSRVLYHLKTANSTEVEKDQYVGFRFGLLDLAIAPLLIDAIFIISIELFRYGCDLISSAKELISDPREKSDYLAAFVLGGSGLLFCATLMLPAYAATTVYPVFGFMRATLAVILAPFLLVAIKMASGTNSAFKSCFFTAPDGDPDPASLSTSFFQGLM